MYYRFNKSESRATLCRKCEKYISSPFIPTSCATKSRTDMWSVPYRWTCCTNSEFIRKKRDKFLMSTVNLLAIENRLMDASMMYYCVKNVKSTSLILARLQGWRQWRFLNKNFQIGLCIVISPLVGHEK